MIILLDAMGGDNAPDANIKGAVNAINQIKAEVLLIGNKEIINGRVKELYGKDKIEDISPSLIHFQLFGISNNPLSSNISSNSLFLIILLLANLFLSLVNLLYSSSAFPSSIRCSDSFPIIANSRILSFIELISIKSQFLPTTA